MPILQGFRERFFLPRGKDWFCEGLVIESASDRTTAPVLPRLSETFPYVKWDLLSRREHPGFRFLFRIKRPLGGVRLLFAARRHYEIVVFFYPARDHDLRLYCWLALLLMRPRRFFVFIENGDGFWLAVEDSEKIRRYLRRRWGLDLKKQALIRFAQHLAEGPRSWGRAAAAALAGAALVLGRGLRWVGLVLYATGAFLVAVLLLGFFRLFYDTYYYRFRFFGKKVTLHPEREFSREAARPEPASKPPVV